MRSVYFCLTSYEQNMTFYVKLQQIWAGPLLGNRVALVLLNRATVPHSITGNWDDIGIPESSVIEARDVWVVILIRLSFLMPLKVMRHFSFAFVFVRYLQICVHIVSCSTTHWRQDLLETWQPTWSLTVAKCLCWSQLLEFYCEMHTWHCSLLYILPINSSYTWFCTVGEYWDL